MSEVSLERKGARYLGHLSAAMVFVGVSSSIGPYGFTDDYRMLYLSIQKQYDWRLELSQGRPVSAIIHWSLISPLNSISDFAFLHLFACLGLALLGFFTFRYFDCQTRQRYELVLISTIPILLTSGLIMTSSWTVLASIPYIFTLLLLLSSIDVSRQSSLKLKSLVVLGLLLTSLYYQPLICIYLVAPILRESFEQNGTLSIDFFRNYRYRINIFFLAGVFSLISFSIFNYLFPSNVRSGFLGPLNAKVEFIITQAIPVSINFASPSANFTWITFLILAVILSFFLINKISFQSCSLLFLGFFLTLLPTLLTNENWASSRSLMTSQWYLAVLFSLATLNLMKLLIGSFQKTTALFLITLSIMHSSALLYSGFHEPQLMELKVAREQISKMDLKNSITVIGSHWYESLAPTVFADEWGLPSSSQPFAVVPLTMLLVGETGNRPVVSSAETSVSGAEQTLDYGAALQAARKIESQHFFIDFARWLKSLIGDLRL